jgi:hypothetical protein
MADMTSEVFYEKLFSAMEAGHPKGERTLLEKMSDHFGLGSEKDVRSALISSVQPEKVMVWLLAEAAPFVKMLDEIYHLLADVKATIFGRADQFSFLFEKINKRVSFPLDSFPKTYLRALTDVEVLTTRFTPRARGHLMIDTPNYWRDDDPHSFEWVIPGGDARAPVAAWTGDGKTVELWYQQKTPLTPEQAAAFGQNNIEPDVRVRSGIVGDTSDLVILELKDRFNAAGSKEKKIARMYATTDARLVCVANYSEFRPRYLRGQVYKEMADGGTEILIVGDFRPGQIPTEVSEAFERAFAKGGRGLPTQFDLIGDISISMPVEARSRTIQALATAGLTPARVFTFDTDLKELPGEATADWPKGGATDLPAALRKYLPTEGRAPSGKALILTDDEGVEQFRRAPETKEFNVLDLRCFDVTEELDGNDLAEWADG